MTYDKSQLDSVFNSTDGRCHLCWASLTRKNYGSQWEVDHSNPRNNGGTDFARNLKPACVPCNRAKQDRANAVIRREHGHTRAPRSKQARETRSTAGGVICALIGAAFGPVGVVLGAIVGTAIGQSDDDRFW